LILPADGGMKVRASPVTTNSRHYLFLVNTNLKQNHWLPLSPAQPGAANGGALTISVPQVEDPSAVFRISVQAP
jgi:hypothetical protein